MAENILLRKQLLIVTRKRKRAPSLNKWQRLLFAFLTAIINPKRVSKLAIVIKPAMLIKFHKALVNKKYSALFSTKTKCKPGPKGPSKDIINAVLAMKQHNPRFGCRRIAMQINLAFGIKINKDIVYRILTKYYKPTSTDSGPSWLTFLAHTKDSLWSIDFFRAESILLKSHWVMVLMDQYSRRIIGFAAHQGNLNGLIICTMLNKVITGLPLPTYLSSDNDPILLFHRWKANLRILEIEEIKSLPHIPMSHPFIERLIRICRDEILDRGIFWNQRDLQQKLNEFQHYFNNHRSHMGLKGDIPNRICGKHAPISTNIRNYRWQSHCKGLFQLPMAA